MSGAIIGILFFVGALVWLYWAHRQDMVSCASILGLTVNASGKQTRGTTSEGFYYHETLLMDGSLQGFRAAMSVRNVRATAFRTKRNRGSLFTVLSLLPDRPAKVSFRLQPVGVMSVLQDLQQNLPVVPTGNAAFDAAYHLYTHDIPATLTVLTPAVQQELLAFRFSAAGSSIVELPAGKLAAGFLLGSVEVEDGKVSYILFGSPTKKLAEHLKLSVSLLAHFAKATHEEELTPG